VTFKTPRQLYRRYKTMFCQDLYSYLYSLTAAEYNTQYKVRQINTKI